MNIVEISSGRGIIAGNRRGCIRYPAWIILALCFLVIYSVQPGFAQIAQTSPATNSSAPTPPETTPTTNPSPWFPPTLLVPQITPLTNPAVISPQAQIDYNLQIPLFSELPFRKELSEKGIDFIAH
jgi:hypothetical protein